MSCDFEAYRILTRGDITKNQQPLAQPPVNNRHPSDGRSIFGAPAQSDGRRYDGPPQPPTQRLDRSAGPSNRFLGPSRARVPKTRYCHRWNRTGYCPKGNQCPNAATHTDEYLYSVPPLEDPDMLGEAPDNNADQHWSTYKSRHDEDTIFYCHPEGWTVEQEFTTMPNWRKGPKRIIPCKAYCFLMKRPKGGAAIAATGAILCTPLHI